MTYRPVLFTQTNALPTVFGILVAACVGREIPIGTGTAVNPADGGADALCDPDQCANQAIGCVFADAGTGTPTDVGCVPDSTAGQGAAPTDASALSADAVPDAPGN
jgi:hypothetical protein